MKRCLLFILLATITSITQAQLEEDFDPAPTGWILSQGAGFNSVNGNAVVNTPGVGGNNPASIGTPAVNKTSNSVKVCFDIWAYDANLNNKTSFPCNTYADILFVNSAVATANDAELAANIYARQDNYLLPTNGGNTCFTFTFPATVTATDFKVFISFKADCKQPGVKYVIDNVSISGVALICGGTNCAPVALNDLFTRGNGTETSFSGALYGSNLSYPSGFTVDAGGTDNDQNDTYAHLQWSALTQPVNGSVVVNTDGTFTVTRNSTTITQLTFTYQLTDDGPDDDFLTTADNMTDNATVTINWPPAGSLPVTFTSFTGNRNGSNVTLQWATSMESNNTGFEVQRSTGNGAYEKVGFVVTKALDGNSSLPLTYQFTETNTAKANTWYRIVQIDKDGVRKMTPVRGVRGMEEVSKLTVYPNPGTASNMNVLFGSSALRDIKIIDLNGKTMKQWNNYHEDNMSITGLHTGIYMLIVTDKDTNGRLIQKIMVK
jgi:type IX secretion system substrate protein/cadherin-like protein